MCHTYLIIVLAVLAITTVLYYFWPYAILALALLLSPLRSPAAPPVTLHPIPAEFFEALRKVESSDRNGRIYGDNGWAIGPYQIHFDYWCDATQQDPSIGGRFEDCLNEGYARAVVTAYLHRWCSAAITQGDYYDMARVHNGGPHGAAKPSTKLYAQRVIMAMYDDINFEARSRGIGI